MCSVGFVEMKKKLFFVGIFLRLFFMRKQKKFSPDLESASGSHQRVEHALRLKMSGFLTPKLARTPQFFAPDCIGQTLGSTWRGGASRGYESLGNETTTARPVFQPWG